MNNIYQKISEKKPGGKGLALATVTESDGSTPQKPGISALFDGHGLLAGTVGGGLVEAGTTEFAIKCIRSKGSGWLHFHLDNDISDKEDAICGGRVTLLVDGNPLKHMPVFQGVREALSKRIPGMLVTIVKGPDAGNVSIDRYWLTEKRKPPMPPEIGSVIIRESENMLKSGSKRKFIKTDIPLPGEDPVVALLEPVFPQKKLIIAGAGHIGKALSHLGRLLDFEVTVIDDRKEYACKINLPDADNIIVSDIGSAMLEIEKTSDTFIVIVTRGHYDDAEALKPCIGSGAAYVGMIGSKVKVARTKAEFISKRWASEDQWSRIYSPIGLDIKSKSVEEIAVSIAAQLVLISNDGN